MLETFMPYIYIFIGIVILAVGIIMYVLKARRIIFAKIMNKDNSIVQYLIYAAIIAGALLFLLGVIDKLFPLSNVANLNYIDNSDKNGIMVKTITTTLFTTFNTINLSLLAVIVTAYVFLIGVFNSREPYEKAVIDSMVKYYTHMLIVLSALTGTCVCLCLTMENMKLAFFEDYHLRYCVIMASLIATIWMIIFLYKIINHNKEIIIKAENMNKDLYQHIVNSEINTISKCGEKRASARDLIKYIGDMELLVNRILNNHEIEFRHSQHGQTMLASIFQGKTSESGDTKWKVMSEQYFALVQYRDNYLCINNYFTDFEINVKRKKEYLCEIEIGNLFEQTQIIMDYLKTYILRNEYLADLTLSGVDFDLKGEKNNQASLEGVSFQNCAITECSFKDANLQNSDFSNVLFHQVQFEGADCTGTVFERARLYDVEFSESTNCKNAVFNEADLNGMRIEGSGKNFQFDSAACKMANLSGCFLKMVNFQYSVFLNATFAHAKIIKCNFESADLSEAIFVSSVVEKSDFRKANMERLTGAYSKWVECCFYGSRMAKTNLSDSKFEGCHFERAYINDVSFAGTDIISVHFEEALLTNSDMTSTLIKKCSFKDAIMKKILLSGKRSSDWGDCQLTGEKNVTCCDTDFTGADMTGALIQNMYFCNCHFDYVLLRNARLKNVVFMNCTFQNIDMTGIDKCNVKGLEGVIECRVDNEESSVACVTETIMKRKSTRNFESTYKLSKDVLKKVLCAGLQAPSPKNRQPWHYFVFNKENQFLLVTILEDKLKQIKIKRQGSEAGVGDLVMAEQTAMAIRQASAVLLVGYEHDEKVGDGEDMGWGIHAEGFEALDLQAIGASIQNMLIEATSMGIDSLWIGDILYAEEEVKENFNLQFPIVAAVALGKEAQKEKPRRSVQEKVSWVFFD